MQNYRDFTLDSVAFPQTEVAAFVDSLHAQISCTQTAPPTGPSRSSSSTRRCARIPPLPDAPPRAPHRPTAACSAQLWTAAIPWTSPRTVLRTRSAH
ncbi:hypothetical protein B484DRAFT_136243 [Ochromonadaceae sp. CCMP2298]|nr:hypothetical protein B484DRAFT_136243 [Ochromonadaceae sp. CCMP2298]